MPSMKANSAVKMIKKSNVVDVEKKRRNVTGKTSKDPAHVVTESL